jgi:hypothetical protein
MAVAGRATAAAEFVTVAERAAVRHLPALVAFACHSLL